MAEPRPQRPVSGASQSRRRQTSQQGGYPASASSQSAEPSAVGLLEVARAGKPHGVRGEILLRPVTNRPERFGVGAVLHLACGPATIVASRPHRNAWIVRFEGIDDRTAASTLTGTTVHAEPLEDPDELWCHELFGATVMDQHGHTRGQVTAVVPNPAADLLETDAGHLVPLTFVTGVDTQQTPRVVQVDAPDGLFELVG